MSWVKNAAKEGVRQAFEEEYADTCEGRNDPEDRCPLPPQHCVCWYLRSVNRPWWKKILSPSPSRPPEGVVFKALIERQIETAIDDAKANQRNRRTPSSEVV